MKRTFYALGGMALLLFASACSMCQHPFDYCSPVAGSGACPNCGRDTREGSAFTSDGPVVSEGNELTTTTAATPTPARKPPRR